MIPEGKHDWPKTESLILQLAQTPYEDIDVTVFTEFCLHITTLFDYMGKIMGFAFKDITSKVDILRKA